MNALVTIVAGLIALFGLSIPGATVDTEMPVLSYQYVSEEDFGGDVLSIAFQKRIDSAPQLIISESLGPVLTAPSALAIDKESGSILFEKNADDIRAIASITKLMTLLVALDFELDMNEQVAILESDYTPLGARTFSVGDTVSLQDIIAATLIPSDNTAAQALARITGIPYQDFIQRMNDKADALGMEHTTFVDTTGLSARNVSTAREILVLAQEAFSRDIVRAFTKQQFYTITFQSGEKYRLRNTNQLIGGMISVQAGKTGFVTQSGYNLVSEVKDNEHAILSVVLGSATNADRFQDLKMLSVWAWENYHWPE